MPTLGTNTDDELAQFAGQTRRMINAGEWPADRIGRFLRFRERIRRELLQHRVIVANPFTRWFERGEMSPDQARQFIVQFSVFSNEFLVAQLRKMLNADSLDEMRASKEILANEIGVTFRAGAAGKRAGDVEPGDSNGTVDGGTFRFRAAHFELLVHMAGHVDLDFNQLGKRKFASPSTLFFCDELIRLYGNADYAVATAASFAVENWAAAGFWDELVRGWKRFKERECPTLPVTFFTWHAQIEANHARHTMEELEEFFFTNEVDEDAFIRDANEMLDGVYAFWAGLAGIIRGTDRS